MYTIPFSAGLSLTPILQHFFLEQTAAGIYTFLPLGLRSLEKAITVIDEEMKGIGM